ncbi:MAG: SOS response-associated peptidase [Aggregatilineales bacterium]
MCGRYTLAAAPEAIQQAFDLESVPSGLTPRYNIAPTQPIPVITNQSPRALTFVTWGLIPSWAKDASMAAQLINARAETLAEKPSFRSAYKYRRCLVPADGFYEWMKDGKVKRPQYIYRRDHALFAFAGLWERWNSPDGSEVLSATIITTEPNATIAPLHHRMAVILDPSDYKIWLDPDADPAVLQALLRPAPDDLLALHEVSSAVNNARHDSPDMIEPLKPISQQRLF